MKNLLLGGTLLASLLFGTAPAQAQAAIRVYTGGIPTWYTWYGYPANMSYYYGPTAFVRPAATVVTPARPMVEVAVPVQPRQEVVYVDRSGADPNCVVRDKVSVPDDRAVIRVAVPANAHVWFQNKLTRQRGTDRVFLSPPIDLGHSLTYMVRATWKEDGRDTSHQKKVTVRPGRDVTVNFLDGDQGRIPTRLEELPRP